MMQYAYTARDALGNVLDGDIGATDREDAIQRLQREGFAVLQIEASDDGGLFPRRVTKQDMIYVTSQLAIMVDTGITLATALTGICEQEENPTLRGVLNDIREQVEGGECFSDALAKHPKHFDETYIALVRASEQTGTLGEMLERIAGFMRKQLDNRSKVRSAMAYPMVMALIAVAVTIFLLTYVLPQFEPMFTRKGVKLPTITVWLMATSDIMLTYWWAWFAGLGGLIGGYFYAKRTPRGQQAIDYTKLHAPIIGTMYRKVILSRTISTLGVMVASGVSMLDSIRLCADVAGNHYYSKSWMHVLDEITNGSTITDALKGNELFPRTLLQMIDSGEETGRLDYVLKRVSEYYDQEVDSSLKATTSLIEPLMICAMGFVVGGIAMGLLLPIFSLSRGG